MADSVMNSYQPSITEWLETLGKTQESRNLREEDNTKAERLEVLFQEIGLPYERPQQFEAVDVTTPSKEFQHILDTRGDELCAIRLVPKKKDLPKLRNRGQSIKDAYGWYLQQNINPQDYFAYLCPHSDAQLWSTIFVVTKDHIFGEIVEGSHSQLTHGDTKHPVMHFDYDFKNWHWSEENSEAQAQIKNMIEMLHVPHAQQKALQNKLQATFSHDYLIGYFETTVWPDNMPYFIDYNRVLPNSISVSHAYSSSTDLQGVSVYPGKVEGRVVVVDAEKISSLEFAEGSILVAKNTDIRFVPLMKKAGAIITEFGGMLSHAAIMARELQKPCIVRVKHITTLVHTGDQLYVNATTGEITRG